MAQGRSGSVWLPREKPAVSRGSASAVKRGGGYTVAWTEEELHQHARLRLGLCSMQRYPVVNAKPCGGRLAVLGRMCRTRVRDPDEMVFIDPSRNTDQGV